MFSLNQLYHNLDNFGIAFLNAHYEYSAVLKLIS